MVCKAVQRKPWTLKTLTKSPRILEPPFRGNMVAANLDISSNVGFSFEFRVSGVRVTIDHVELCFGPNYEPPYPRDPKP